MTPWMLLAAALAGLVLQPAPPGDGSSRASRVVTERLTSAVFDNTRTLRIYLPPGYDDDVTRRYPVLYLNDGFAVFSPRSWAAPATLDRLIAAGAIPPIVVVGIDNAASIDGAASPTLDRTREYLPYREALEPELRDPMGLRFPAFLVDEVLPFVTARYRTSAAPADVAVGGSSYGAIAALVAVMQRPGVFGGLLLESAPLFVSGARLVDEATRVTQWPASISIAVGAAETADRELLARGELALSRFVDILNANAPATRLRHVVDPDGTHDSAAWRRRLAPALVHLFGRK